MLVHINRDEFKCLAKQATLAVPKKSTIKELSGIHIEADARRSMLTLTATNLEIAIRTSMGAVVERSGSVVLNAKVLAAITSQLTEETLDMELMDSGQISIHAGATGYCLNVLSGDKYPMPELPFPDDTVSVSGLWSLVRQTAFVAMEEADKAPIMSCIKLALGPDGLKGISTNGYCIMEAWGDKDCKGRSELLIPARSLAVLAALSKDSDVYEMGLAGKSVVFWNGTMLFSARLMEGSYPNTGMFFDKFQAKYTVNLAAEELTAAVASVSVVAADNPRMELCFGEHEILVSTETDQGRAAIPVKALVLNAPGAPFYYNPKILLKYLKLLHGSVTLDFDVGGLLAVCGGPMQYIQSPLRPPKPAAQPEKTAQHKKSTQPQKATRPKKTASPKKAA